MWPTKKKKPGQRHIGEFSELDGGGGIPDFFFTRVQIKPKILQR